MGRVPQARSRDRWSQVVQRGHPPPHDPVFHDRSYPIRSYWPQGRERRAIDPHAMHNDGEPASESDACLAHPAPPRDIEGPVSEPILAFAAGKDRVGGFIEQPTNHAVATFGNSSSLLDLTGRIYSWCETEDGADGLGLFEP